MAPDPTPAPTATRRLLAQAQLAAALLDRRQMPPGWIQDGSGEDSATPQLCEDTSPAAAAATGTSWTMGSAGPRATTTLRQYTSTDQARAAYTALQGATGCGTFTSGPNQYTIFQVAFPQLGQGTLAARVTDPAGAQSLLTWVLDGPTIVQVAASGPGTDPAQVETILRAQVNKYDRAAGG